MRVALVALFLVGYFAILFVASIAKGLVPPTAVDLTWGTLSSLGILPLTIAMLRVDARRHTPLHINTGTLPQLGVGFILGVAVYLLTLAVISVTVGPLRISIPATTPSLQATTMVVLGFLALSLMEELGFRGYPLRALIASTDALAAVMLTAIAFAASHLLFGWPLETVLVGVLPSGILFGTAAIVSGGLALPIGLHAAVNITMWAVGEKGAPGFVALTIDPIQTATAARFSPMIGAAVPLLVSAALWRWHPRPAGEALVPASRE